MALNEAAHRLYVGCRRPASVSEFNTDDGRLLASVDTVADTDDLFFDANRKRLYVIGGQGFIDVISAEGDIVRRAARVDTAGGARTGLWVGEQDRLYVAIPARRGHSAEVRVFEAH
jgi:hypothetical protein